MIEDSTSKLVAKLVRADGADAPESKESAVLQEHRLEIIVNEQLAFSLVCTATDLEELVIGRLVSEQIVKTLDEVDELRLCDSGNRARVFLKKPANLQAAKQEEPTCCTDNKVLLQQMEVSFKNLPKITYEKEWIFHLVNTFSADSKLHKSTGGTHSCMLALKDQILYKAEDIGRHNAMDKAIGYMAKQKLNPADCILFTTGRVPTDMVRKVIAAGIPVLVSKAVPTKDAVEMAEKYGLNLLCRAWPDSYEIYA